MKVCKVCKTDTPVELWMVVWWKKGKKTDLEIICPHCSINFFFPILSDISNKVLVKNLQ